MLIKGPGSPRLTERVSDESDEEVIEVEKKIFPDGEIYIRLKGDVSGEDCTLIQSTYPNEHLLELFLIQDALAENEADSVKIVIPYFSYSRQDKRFEEGEPVSARAVARRIDIQADQFFSVDLHSEYIIDFFDIAAENLTAMPLLAEHAKVHDPDLLLSPDEGGKERVRRAAEVGELSWDYLEKKRLDSERVEMRPKNIDVEGKTVVILDDIISTGGTMKEAGEQLIDQGADEIHAGCTHGLFVDDSWKRLDNAFDSVFCTDSIECEKSEVTLSPLILGNVL